MHHRSAQFQFNLYPHPELGYYECGRDLFTFVTVASSHIMRTLQRPKKSRPTKRKVNHRRFLQNQICRKYSIIEAATHQLATSIFSQEAAVQKQLSKPKNTDSSEIQKRTDISTDTRKDRVSPIPTVLNISTSVTKLPETCLGDSTFLGVAEAYFVPDAISKVGVTMDTLTCVSDEVGTVESLFDDIIVEDDIFESSYGLPLPRTQYLSEDPENDDELQRHLQAGLLFYDGHLSSWLPESFNRTVHQLPLLQTTSSDVEYTDRNIHGFLLDHMDDLQTTIHDINKQDSREVNFENNIRNEFEHQCLSDESDCSVIHTRQGASKWITTADGFIFSNGGDPNKKQCYGNEDLDSSVFSAGAMQHNVNQTLWLRPQEK